MQYSVVIPCYNEEHFIVKTLKALELSAANHLDKLEVLIVLNNCVDKTEEVVEHYKIHTHLKIKILKEPRPGVSFARNYGANHATSEYLIFLDADNTVQKSFFNDIDNAITHQNALAGTIRTMPDRLSLGGYLFFGLLDLIKTTIKKPFGKSFIHKRIFHLINGYDTSIELGENVDFLVRAKQCIKSEQKQFCHISIAIYCSLRRFDEQSYFSIAIPWAIAYFGVKTLKYETFSAISKKNRKRKILSFSIPYLTYFNSYILYPMLEKYQNRDIQSKVKALATFDRLSVHERERAIQKKLYEICKEASLHVPYYRDLFIKIGFDPKSILIDIGNLQKVPYLTKEIIHHEGSRLLNETYSKSTLHERKTGGSTGVSTLIYYSQEALDWTVASNLHSVASTGKKRHMREVYLSSFIPETLSLKKRVKESIKCISLNRINITTHAFDAIDIADVIERLIAAKAFYIEGHPSTMYAIAEYIKYNNLIFDNPLFQVFESTGEVLDQKKREVIEKIIQCKVYDRYGNAEFGIVAHETDNLKHALKVLDNMVVPELITKRKSDENSEHFNDTHELVLTTLTNKAMPLIRYCTGDMVSNLEVREDGHYLDNVVGRIHDLIKIGNKTYPTHYIQDILNKIGGISEFQIEELEESRVQLYLVAPDVNFHNKINKEIERLWGMNIIIKYIELNQLKRLGWRDKFRYVIPKQSQQAENENII